MREANNIIHKLMCEEQHMRNKRVWSIKHSNTDFGLPKVCLYGICKYSPLFQRGLWSLTSPYPCLCRLEISTLCCAFAFWNWGSGLVSSHLLKLNQVNLPLVWIKFIVFSCWKSELRGVVTQEEHTVLGKNKIASGEEAFRIYRIYR